MERNILKKTICALVLLAVSFGNAAESSVDIARELHYEVSWHKDVPLTAFAAFASIWGNYRYSQMEVPMEGEFRDASELLPWDRPFAGRYNESADVASDWMIALGVAPLALAGASWYRGDAQGADFASYTLMFAQALAIQNGVNLLVRTFDFWPRPYIYAESGAGARAAAKAKGEAYGSFFSGHTSAAFTVAVFTGEWFSEYYPNSPYKGVVWASAFSAAGFVGVLRMAAGKHYPSDVVAGALVGTGISFAVIRAHKNLGQNLSFWAFPGSCGLLFRI